MPYNKVHEDWRNFPDVTTPVMAEDLEQMEQGIFDATAVAEAAVTDAAAALANHDSDTSNVHGIPNTANLETVTGAQAKADAAQAAATAAAATDATNKVGVHSSDTTDVHGIANTANLETAAGAQAKVDTHVNDATAAHAASAVGFTPAGGIVATDAQAAIVEARADAVARANHTGVQPASTISDFSTAVFAAGAAADQDLQNLTADFTAHEAEGEGVHAAAFDEFAQGLVQFSPRALRTSYGFYEEFLGGGSNASGNIGELGWLVESFAGAGTIIYPPVANVGGEPGAVGIQVTALNDCLGINLDPALQPQLDDAFIFEFNWRINTINNGTEDVNVRMGLFSNTGPNRPNSGAWVEYVSGDTALRTCTRSNIGTTQQFGGSGGGGPTVAQGTWYTITIIGDGGGNIDFFLDDDGTFQTPLFTHTTIPNHANDVVTPRLVITKSASAASSARNIRIGYVYYKQTVAR